MGEVRTDVEIINPETKQSIVVNALVDSGAVVPMVGRDVIEAIGVKPDAKAIVYLADDSSIEMDKVEMVKLKIDERGAGCSLLVGDYGIEPLIGQVVLEQLDLLIDCQKQKLVKRTNSPAFTSYKLK